MNKFIFILLYSITTLASNNFRDSMLVNRIGSVADTHGKIISNSLSKFFSEKVELERFDMQVGVTASGDVGLLSFSGGAAAEFVWQKNLPEGLPGDDINEEEPTLEQVDAEVDLMTQEQVYSHLYKELDNFLNFQKIKKRKRNKIIKVLRSDAQKISLLIRNLVLMPRIGNWYVGGFFKNYSFNTGVSLGAVSLGKSKRVRFRFKVKNRPYILSHGDHLTSGQKRLKKMMENFNALSARNNLFQQFSLERVFAIHSLTAGLDLAVFSSSFTKGVQIEYKKAIDDIRLDIPGLNFNSLSKIYYPIRTFNEAIIHYFDNKSYTDTNSELSLHQIRVKYSLDKGVGFKVLTVEKSSTLEFHYKR